MQEGREILQLAGPVGEVENVLVQRSTERDEGEERDGNGSGELNQDGQDSGGVSENPDDKEQGQHWPEGPESHLDHPVKLCQFLVGSPLPNRPVHSHF